MSSDEPRRPIAGKHFPWEQVAGYFLRLVDFAPFTLIEGDHVGQPKLGAYALVGAELPNPDIEPAQRILSLPIEHASDYKSLIRAHNDSGVRSGTNEIVILYEHRRGLFGRKQPGMHVAAFPAGTWQQFFEA